MNERSWNLFGGILPNAGFECLPWKEPVDRLFFCANRLDSLNLDCMIPPAWYFKLSRKLRLCLSQVLATTHLNWFLAPNEYELFVLIGCSTEKTVRMGFIEKALIGHLFFSQEMSWKVTQSTSWKAKISILEFVQVCPASIFFNFYHMVTIHCRVIRNCFLPRKSLTALLCYIAAGKRGAVHQCSIYLTF